MSKRVLSILGLIIPIGFFLYKTYKEFINSVQVNILGIKVDKKRSTLSRIILQVSLEVVNPTLFSFKIKGYLLKVLANNLPIARSLKMDTVSISPKSRVVIPLVVAIDNFNTGSTILSNIQQLLSGKGLDVLVKGKVLTGYGPIAVNEKIKVLDADD